ncbi:hypothetical protein HTV45_30960 [Streptomyces sp. CHD11]|uniref:hypothetical protein n=1 Tax=Streptomyces sp. CHD11 TaxID=2741325 RepID=UPI001BFC54EB|nr:hypothetical protein [Streptomyces sp. CHD11]MBT3155234.1 hypothetical protein [Streptomyces sp. CHD11]
MIAFLHARTGAPVRRRVAVTAGVAAAAVFATTAGAHASESAPESTPVVVPAQVQAGSAADEAAFAEIEKALRLITDIPEDVLSRGDEAARQWLTQRVEGELAKESKGGPQRAFSATGCARGILLAIGSNVFAVAKIYKMKKAIDKLGGISKVVKNIRSKKKAGKTFKKGIAEVFEEAGGGLGGMAASILGVDGVIKHCW